MLDRLKQKTTLKFDKDRLTALCDSIRNDFQKKVVINNELGKWWHWPLSRIFGHYQGYTESSGGTEET
jgi:hypothetical protein